VGFGVGDRISNGEVDGLDVDIMLEDYDALMGCGIGGRGGVGELGGRVEDCLEGGLVGYGLDSSRVDAPI
jgi:hypothetical protein